jgi:hypothetical protein
VVSFGPVGGSACIKRASTARERSPFPPQRDTAVPQPEWFDVATHPQASFTADHFVAKGGDAYEAPGKLTIRGAVSPAFAPSSLPIPLVPQQSVRLRFRPLAYIFSPPRPGPRNNPNPAAQSITDVQLLSAFQQCFRGAVDELTFVTFEVQYRGADLVRTTKVERAGAVQRVSTPTAIQRAQPFLVAETLRRLLSRDAWRSSSDSAGSHPTTDGPPYEEVCQSAGSGRRCARMKWHAVRQSSPLL